MFSAAPLFRDATVPPLAARKGAFTKWAPSITADVTALDLTDRNLNDKQLSALHEWSGLPSLRRLRVANNNLKSEGIVSVLRACSESLQVLDLSATKAKADLIPMLATLPWPQLQTLILDHTNLKNGFGEAQLDAPELTTLSAREAGINAGGIKGLLGQGFFPALTSLAIDFNPIGRRAIADILRATVDIPLAELRVEMADQPNQVLEPFFGAKARNAMSRFELPWDFPQPPNLDAFTGLLSLKLGYAHGDILAHPVVQNLTSLALSTFEPAPVPLQCVTHIDLGIGQSASDAERAGAAKWLESFAGSAVTALDVGFAPDDQTLFDAAASLCRQLNAVRLPIASPSRFAAWVNRSPHLRTLAAESAHHNANASNARHELVAAASDLVDLRHIRLVLDEESPADALRALRAQCPSALIDLRPFVEGNFSAHDKFVDELGATLIFDDETPLPDL